jgi:thiamine-monophosphate kinase
MIQELPLGPGVEFDAIREMVARWGPRAMGIGDDAAVFTVARGDSVVVSVDSAIEGRHFKREWFTPREIGFRSVTAALSDLAAMGARPTGILVALGLPNWWRTHLAEIADGIGDALDAVGAPILGGNLSGGNELSIATTVMGTVFSPLTRSGARVGDHVYVTGALGAPGEALRRLYAGELAGEYRERLAHPVARIAEARWLAEFGASAAIDVSDGLLADLRHLATASFVSMRLDPDRIPLVDGVDQNAALMSGEEFELIVTSPRQLDVESFEKRFGLPLTKIGEAVDGLAGVVHVGHRRVSGPVGYDHFFR